MYLNILLLPILGSAVSGFFGRKVGVLGAELITCTAIFIITILCGIIFFEVGFSSISVSINLIDWVSSEWFKLVWGFQFDSLTVCMLIPVLIISLLVHIYSIGYMSSDPHIQRFFSYLSLFTFMMIVLVTANNYLLMFLGWEGVGVCSYLLVNFWFTRIAANQSSISAFLTNRVGDCFLTIGLISILWSLGCLNYGAVFSLVPYINKDILVIIGICLLIGAMAKSSQIGLHVWLPMAMEGPTPVSALIHAATMVTAGVYLLIRSSPLIEYSSTILLLCLWLGAITTVFSSLVGLFQNDIKKIIAYSTMSQLGMMFISIGLSSYTIALLHLINHAFYKGLLFLSAGMIIHSVSDLQDLRKYGSLINYLPITYSVMLIASLSLVAFPFLTGYYSKDFIIELSYGQYSYSGITIYFITTFGAILTCLYSVKILYLTFLSHPNNSSKYYGVVLFFNKLIVKKDHTMTNMFKNFSKQVAHEGDIFMTVPLIILAVFAIFFGFIFRESLGGIGSNLMITYSSSELDSIFSDTIINTESGLSTIIRLLPFILSVSFGVAYIIVREYMPLTIIQLKSYKINRSIYGFFNQRGLIEYFYNKFVSNVILNLGGQTSKILDKGAIEDWGPYGLEKILMRISMWINSLSEGVVTTYALFIVINLLLYLSIYSSLQNMSYYLLGIPSILFLLLSLNLKSSKDN